MTKKITDFFALEGNYPDLDAEGAVARLSQAIQCRTIYYADHSLTDYSEFDKLHAHMKASYPHVMRAGVFERLGHHAVLITIPGSDKTLRPCLYMSHQDVVPVVEGTEQDWTYPAFSGAVADGFIWGRGTLDIKNQVFGVLEAAEYLLARGRTFRRTAYLAFGDDEETLNTGALAISDHLKAQGVNPADVTLVNISQKELIEALIAGSIDALAASEPTPTLTLEKVPGSRELANLSGLGNDYPLLIVASRAYADAHPEAIKAVVDGTARAVAFINAAPVAAGTETAAVTGAPAALETGMFRKMEWRLRLDDQTLKSLGITAEFLHSIGKLKKIPDLEARSRPQFVQRAVGSHQGR